MKTMYFAATILASFAAATAAQAAPAPSADASAGAKIVAPLEISNTASLYFGTIAPSTTQADEVYVSPQGNRKCGQALTCLTADHSAAAFKVTGESNAFYTVSLPKEIKIVNEKGNAMLVSDFEGSKAKGQLIKGEDTFTVGGTLEVGVRQEAGKYTGSFTVAVEYQ